MQRLGIVFGLIMLLQPTQGFAQENPRVQVRGDQWIVEYGDYQCTLARRFGDEDSTLFALSSYLGNDEPRIVMVRDGAAPLPDLPRRVTILLSPGDRREPAETVGYNTARGRAIRIEGIAEGFFDRFASSESVTIEAGRRSALTMRTPGAGRAVAALRACNDDLLGSWGIDVAAQAALSRRPRLTRGSINSSDYPTAAIRANQHGIVVMRARVGTDGVPQECRVVYSANTPILDAATCALVTERFRFEHALNANGEPVVADYVRTIRWLLPQ